MRLKITTLIENEPDLEGLLRSEHGLSLLIQKKDQTILFDTGQTGLFVENAQKRQIDLNQINQVILSHGHYDHSGGLLKLLTTMNHGAKVIVGRSFFQPKYKKIQGQQYTYNGNPFTRKQLEQYEIQTEVFLDDMKLLEDDIVLFRNFSKTNCFEKSNPRFVREINGEFMNDSFEDEIVLGVCLEEGMVVIVGCAHSGIVTILENIQMRMGIPIIAVIGGTHLIEADETRITKTIEFFRSMKIQRIAVSHCTGRIAVQKMAEELGDCFEYNNTGNVLEFF